MTLEVIAGGGGVLHLPTYYLGTLLMILCVSKTISVLGLGFFFMFTLLFEKYMIILGSFSNLLYYSCIIINHFRSLFFGQVAV